MKRRLIFGAHVVISSCLLVAGMQIYDNQPDGDSACPIQDTTHTESADGSAIGIHNYGCRDHGVNVVWSVSVPRECEQGGCGLIIDIHGATMNAEVENNGSQLREYGWKARRRGAAVSYVVAQPNLTDLFDSTSMLDPSSVFGGAYLNELASMDAFIEDLKARFKVNPNHMHLYGFSRGTHTANVYYCDEKRRAQFASFGMHGEQLKCDVNDKPLIMLNGLSDLHQKDRNAQAIRRLDALGATSSVVHADWNDTAQGVEWVLGLFPSAAARGQRLHTRHRLGDKWYESIQHNGATYPLVGHCLPTTQADGWLHCQANFDTGEEIIDFFIAHPGGG